MAEEKEEFTDPQFDVFQNENIDVSTSGLWTKIIHPIESLDNEGDIRFQIDANEKFWMQWGESKVTLEAGIQKADAGGRWIDLEPDDDVIFANNAAHTIFQDVKVKINYNAIEGGNNLYAWLAYMNNHLQFCKVRFVRVVNNHGGSGGQGPPCLRFSAWSRIIGADEFKHASADILYQLI